MLYPRHDTKDSGVYSSMSIKNGDKTLIANPCIAVASLNVNAQMQITPKSTPGRQELIQSRNMNLV